MKDFENSLKKIKVIINTKKKKKRKKKKRKKKKKKKKKKKNCSQISRLFLKQNAFTMKTGMKNLGHHLCNHSMSHHLCNHSNHSKFC
jgi:hypothetical protein